MRAYMVLAVAILVTACSPSGERAREAVAEAEEAITAQHAAALRFAPDAFAAVMERYAAAKDRYDAEDWAGAVEAAEEATRMARQLSGPIAEGRQRATERWPETLAGVDSMVGAVRSRLDEALRTGRYPDGMTAEDVRDARAEVDSLAAGLERADREFAGGDLAGALHAAERVGARAGALMGRLGGRPANPHGR